MPPKLNLIERLASRMGLAEATSAKPPASPRHDVVPAVPPATEAAPAAPMARASGRRVELAFERLQGAGMIVPGSARTRLSEEFRLIKRPLLLKAFDAHEGAGRGNLIMVTSARPGEGKTFTAVNLAMSLVSEADLNVLLIDADVVRPSVMATLGLSDDEAGLVEAVSGTVGLTDALVRCTNVPNLSILPSGRPISHVTELLASRRMAEFMADIANRYPDRVVIIDTPPVLVTSETSVLALHVGQILMVVGADVSGPKPVDAALKLVSSCPNVSLVLNRLADRRRPGDFGARTYGS